MEILCPSCGSSNVTYRKLNVTLMCNCHDCKHRWGIRDPSAPAKGEKMPAEKPEKADGPEAPKETRVNPPPLKGGDKARPMDGPMAKTELRHLLTGIYNIPGQAGLVDVVWEEKDFDASASELVDLLDRFPILRIVLRALAPLVGIVDLVRKARTVFEAAQRKRAANSPPQVIDHVPGENGGNAAPEQGFSNIFRRR